jgi:hypothetical protein
MQYLDGFIDDNREKLEAFFREVSNKPAGRLPDPVPVPEHVHFYSLAVLHEILHRFRGKVACCADACRAPLTPTRAQDNGHAG